MKSAIEQEYRTEDYIIGAAVILIPVVFLFGWPWLAVAIKYLAALYSHYVAYVLSL